MECEERHVEQALQYASEIVAWIEEIISDHPSTRRQQPNAYK